MKTAASILAILMLFSTAQPVLVQCQYAAAEAKEAKACCSKTCRKKQQKDRTDKDCNRADACNPFAGCAQCQYIAVSKFLYAGNFLKLLKPVSYPQDAAIVSGFLSDCWHPPELFSC